MSPYVPVCLLLYVAPNDWAQSSICLILCSFTILLILSNSHACPNRLTDRTALVLLLISLAIFLGFILNVWGLISAKIGFAPTKDIDSAVAK